MNFDWLAGTAARWSSVLLRGHHNLVRTSDRIDAWVTVCAVLAATMMLPVAAALGTVAYSDVSAGSQMATATGHRVEATYTAVGDGTPGNIEHPSATWIVAGRTVTGVVAASADAETGARFELWIDRNGNPAPEPASGSAAAASGVGVAVALWISVVIAIAVSRACVHRYLVRRRSTAWDRAWVSLDVVPDRPVG